MYGPEEHTGEHKSEVATGSCGLIPPETCAWSSGISLSLSLGISFNISKSGGFIFSARVLAFLGNWKSLPTKDGISS